MGTYFERNVEFSSGEGRLALDGLRTRDGEPDLLVDVHYYRKAYQEGSAYRQLVERKVALYQLLTGRPAKWIMLAIVGRENMLAEDALPLTRAGVAATSDVLLKRGPALSSITARTTT